MLVRVLLTLPRIWAMSREHEPTLEEKGIAYNLERVATTDFMSGRMTLAEYNFLMDRLLPYTKLDLRKMADYQIANDRTLRNQETVEVIKEVIQGFKDLFHLGTRAS